MNLRRESIWIRVELLEHRERIPPRTLFKKYKISRNTESMVKHTHTHSTKTKTKTKICFKKRQNWVGEMGKVLGKQRGHEFRSPPMQKPGMVDAPQIPVLSICVGNIGKAETGISPDLFGQPSQISTF